MLGSENKENIDRREFIITLVLSITSVLLAACTRILGKTQEYEIRYPPTASKSPPTPTANKTDTVVVETATPTTHKTDTVVAETSTPVADDCKQWEEERPDSDGKDRSNTKLAETRSCNEITYAIIHHSQEEGAEGYSCLVRKAQKYDYIHSYRVYNDDGVIDARFTMGEKGYKWISYHFLIGRDGLCLAVQNPKYVRVHAQNDDVNRRSIAICLDGDFRPREQKGADETPTDKQLQAAAGIIREWNEKQNVSLEITGHREVACLEIPCDENRPKPACPGDNMGDVEGPNSKLNEIKKLVYQ